MSSLIFMVHELNIFTLDHTILVSNIIYIHWLIFYTDDKEKYSYKQQKLVAMP